MNAPAAIPDRCDYMKKLKRKLIIAALFVLSGFFVYTTADVQSEIMAMFLGSVASASILTITFFLAGMLQETPIKEKIYPYAIVFALLIMWIIVLTGLRVVL